MEHLNIFSGRNGIFKENGEGRWPGRNGPVACSPDFNPLNFFLCVGDYHSSKQEETYQ
jgi:hypothetical protein